MISRTAKTTGTQPIEPPSNCTSAAAAQPQIDKRASKKPFPPQQDIEDNNNRTLYVVCKAACEDLLEVKTAFGEDSQEYRDKMADAYRWIGKSLPAVLEGAISDLARRGHDAPSQTTRTV